MSFQFYGFWVFACAVLALSLSDAVADEYLDARKILDARNGTIIKWTQRPRIVVVKDHQVEVPSLSKLLKRISDVTSLEIADPAVHRVDGIAALGSFYKESDVETRRHDDALSFELTLGFSEPTTVVGNFFIFVLPYEIAAHVMALTGFGQQNAALSRAYFTKRGCFFSLISKKGAIKMARIFIPPDLDGQDFEECLYEEVTQAFGFPNDAQGSEYFTYDNLAGNKPQDRDMRLLAALYRANIQPGDSVDAVIENYRKNSVD